jgi:hypothetical protein
MSDIEEFLEHHGVKGMRWGIRRKRGSDGRVTGSVPRVSREAKVAAASAKKLRAHGVSSLTNKELADLNKRLNLEQQANKLNPSQVKKGHDAIKEVLAVGATVNAAILFAKSPAGQAIAKSIRNRK